MRRVQDQMAARARLAADGEGIATGTEAEAAQLERPLPLFDPRRLNDPNSRYTQHAFYLENLFEGYDRDETAYRATLRELQAECPGPRERRRFILFGEKIIRCMSPLAPIYEGRVTKPEHTG